MQTQCLHAALCSVMHEIAFKRINKTCPAALQDDLHNHFVRNRLRPPLPLSTTESGSKLGASKVPTSRFGHGPEMVWGGVSVSQPTFRCQDPCITHYLDFFSMPTENGSALQMSLTLGTIGHNQTSTVADQRLAHVV